MHRNMPHFSISLSLLTDACVVTRDYNKDWHRSESPSIAHCAFTTRNRGIREINPLSWMSQEASDRESKYK